jgi:hypothetical protein
MTKIKQRINLGKISGEATIIMENLGLNIVSELLEEGYLVQHTQSEGKQLFIITI